MQPPLVFINKGLASTLDILKIVRGARRPGEFRLIVSHPRANFAGQWVADAFEVEPDNLSTSEYVAWCLELSKRHRVSLFVPGRMACAIAAARELFEAAGVRLLLAADPPTLALLEDKASCYAALGPDVVPRPEHIVANDLAGFESAVLALRHRRFRVCFKPTTSIYGLGFRVIGRPSEQSVHPLRVSLEQALRYVDRKPFRRQLVMRYLSGRERSVDCLAQRGRLILAIIRRKGFEHGMPMSAKRAAVFREGHVESPVGVHPQWLEANEPLQSVIRQITVRLKLDGMFNVQFRDDRRGSPHLLEINARMSGGLPMACQSGVPVPYWAIRLALGTAQASEVPQPRTGFVALPSVSGHPEAAIR